MYEYIPIKVSCRRSLTTKSHTSFNTATQYSHTAALQAGDYFTILDSEEDCSADKTRQHLLFRIYYSSLNYVLMFYVLLSTHRASMTTFALWEEIVWRHDSSFKWPFWMCCWSNNNPLFLLLSSLLEIWQNLGVQLDKLIKETIKTLPFRVLWHSCLWLAGGSWV